MHSRLAVRAAESRCPCSPHGLRDSIGDCTGCDAQVTTVSHSHLTRRVILLLLTVGLLTMGVVPLAQASPPAQSPEEGQAIFQQKCISCHTIGKGKLVGPDLQGVTARRERAWLARWIAQPDKLLAERDPIAMQLLAEYNNVPMPNQALTEAEVSALLAYLATQTGGAAAQPAPATAAALPAGNPIIGKDLFTGVIQFQNGGPPCMGCHSIAGIGALGGGALGPDLTPAFNKFGDAGIASILTTLPFPTMNPIFSQRPLTPQEQAHVKAFLGAAVAERPTQAVGQLALLSVAGTAVLLALAQVYWRRRLTEVRRPMVGRQRLA